MAGTWQSLAHQPAFNTGTMILLTDGRVMVQEEGTAHWHALTPDSNGSYLNGSWSTLDDMSFWRRYYASGILRDGRVIIVGGEQSGDVGDTPRGEIYDPVADSWTEIPSPPGWTQVGDAASSILPDGRLMIGALLSGACMIYDPVAGSWSVAASKALRSNEETWVLLPDNTIVTPQCWSPFGSEKYLISSNTWKNEGSPPVTLVDPVMNEIGPAMLMYNGKVIFFGAANSGGNGKTALYTPPSLPTGTGTWTAGPNIPKVGGQTMVSNDCPASLLPNGKVLFTASKFLNNDWGSPIYFFEYDPTANTIAPAPTPSNNAAQIYWSRMMLLPTGQVLFSPSSSDVQCYTPDGGPAASWRPTITSVAAYGIPFFNPSFTLLGTGLNGWSQANMYGDDCHPATNYPLVQLRNAVTSEVHFCRTTDFSSLAVATGGATQSVRFTVPNIATGTYKLCVIANGISSDCMDFYYTQPKKPMILDVGLKREFEYFGKLIAEGDPWDREQWVIDPEIIELKGEVKRLKNSVRRLSSLIKTKELPRVGKDIANRAATEDREAMAPRPAPSKAGSKEPESARRTKRKG
jgi:Kelch motif